MSELVQFPGTVEWAGENPGILLKDDAEGPFVALATFFRVVLSPHGRGEVLVLLQAPDTARPAADEHNVCIADNAELARYLLDGYVSHFGAWKDLPGLQNLEHRPLDRVETAGDPRDTYSETLHSGNLTVQLTWSGLSEPFSFALPPAASATGAHWMPSLFIGSREASIKVNDRALPGRAMPREFAGHDITTAMLAFSEAWVRA